MGGLQAQGRELLKGHHQERISRKGQGSWLGYGGGREGSRSRWDLLMIAGMLVLPVPSLHGEEQKG